MALRNLQRWGAVVTIACAAETVLHLVLIASGSNVECIDILCCLWFFYICSCQADDVSHHPSRLHLQAQRNANQPKSRVSTNARFQQSCLDLELQPCFCTDRSRVVVCSNHHIHMFWKWQNPACKLLCAKPYVYPNPLFSKVCSFSHLARTP